MSSINKSILKKEDFVLKDESIHIDDRVVAKRDVFKNETFKKAKININKEIEEYRERLLEKARKEIEEYTTNEKEKIHKKAEEASYNRVYGELDKHYQESYREKLEYADEIIRQANEKKMEVEKNLSKLKREWMNENEEDIVKILVESTKKIIGETMQVNSESVSNLLQETIKEVDDHSKKIWISVSEKASEVLEEKKYKDHNIQIIVDPSLKDLDIMLKSDEKMIDGTMNNKIKRLKELLGEWLDASGPFK